MYIFWKITMEDKSQTVLCRILSTKPFTYLLLSHQTSVTLRNKEKHLSPPPECVQLVRHWWHSHSPWTVILTQADGCQSNVHIFTGPLGFFSIVSSWCHFQYLLVGDGDSFPFVFVARSCLMLRALWDDMVRNGINHVDGERDHLPIQIPFRDRTYRICL